MLLLRRMVETLHLLDVLDNLNSVAGVNLADVLVVGDENTLSHLIAAPLKQGDSLLRSKIWFPVAVEQCDDERRSVSVARVGNLLQSAEVVQVVEMGAGDALVVAASGSIVTCEKGVDGVRTFTAADCTRKLRSHEVCCGGGASEAAVTADLVQRQVALDVLGKVGAGTVFSCTGDHLMRAEWCNLVVRIVELDVVMAGEARCCQQHEVIASDTDMGFSHCFPE